VLATAHCTTGNSWFWQETLPHPNRPFSRLYLWHPLSKVLIHSETRLMFLEWFNPHQARADGKQEMSPPKECKPLSKLVKRVWERGKRHARAGRCSSVRSTVLSLSHSLTLAPSPSLESVIQSLPSPSQQSENIIYWQFAYVGRPSVQCLHLLLDNTTAKWNPH